jgi:hypothetical protein
MLPRAALGKHVTLVNAKQIEESLAKNVRICRYPDTWKPLKGAEAFLLDLNRKHGNFPANLHRVPDKP